MTTIAWDRDARTLAGDTLATAGGLPYRATKIHRLSDGRLYGGSGNAEDLFAVLHWLDQGGEKPKVTDFAALLIGTDGRCQRMESALVPFPVAEPFHAIGSGRDFAILAMRLGKSAQEAVALAAEFDIYTGGEIQALSLDTYQGDNVFWLSESGT